MADDSGENGRKPGVLEDIKNKTRELGETLKLKARQQAEELKKP